MATQLNLPKAPKIQFRVLIIGKANAGKTSILQRVCDTTDSPEIYRSGEQVQLNPTIERGEHDIEDELIFSHHDGYVFHDSRGFEGGSDDELKTVQDFVRRRSQERRLKDRLHAIWYCVPMDSPRPSLELKHFEDICPDKSVPVIAVFTKFDQFSRDIGMKLEDQGRDPDDLSLVNAEMERIFNEEFLINLKGSPPVIRLERMHKPSQRCAHLIETTANALSSKAVALMLLTVQKNNLELNINRAVKWAHSVFLQGKGSTEMVLKSCILAFPSIWYPDCYESGNYGKKEEFEEGLSSRQWEKNEDTYLNGELQNEEPYSYFRSSVSEKITNALFSKISSLFTKPPLFQSSGNDTHHRLIAIILILEHACLSYASQPKPTRDEALDMAYSRYCASGVHNEVVKQFVAPLEKYSILQFTEFVLLHRL